MGDKNESDRSLFQQTHEVRRLRPAERREGLAAKLPGVERLGEGPQWRSGHVLARVPLRDVRVVELRHLALGLRPGAQVAVVGAAIVDPGARGEFCKEKSAGPLTLPRRALGRKPSGLT